MSKVVAISGMYRSGTSVFASCLQAAGVYLGDKLIPGDKGNPNGYFEDKDIVELHNELLSANDLGIFLKDSPPEKIKIENELQSRAQQLIDDMIAKGKGSSIAWKDGRAALFLDFWQNSIEAKQKFIILYRSPLSVVDSLLRRDTDKIVRDNPSLAFKTYLVFNRRYLRFLTKNKEDVITINIDKFLSSPIKYLEVIDEKFDLNLDLSGVLEVIKVKEFKFRKRYSRKTIKEAVKNIFIYLNCWLVYNKLESISLDPDF